MGEWADEWAAQGRLSTDYLGLKLKNPLEPSASPLSKNIDTALRLEDAGTAALVMYSLFEEELCAEDAMLDRLLLHADLGHDKADGFLPDYSEFQGGLERYFSPLNQLKRRPEIPVAASLNGVSPAGWVELGHALEQSAPMRSGLLKGSMSRRTCPILRSSRAPATCGCWTALRRGRGYGRRAGRASLCFFDEFRLQPLLKPPA